MSAGEPYVKKYIVRLVRRERTAGPVFRLQVQEGGVVRDWWRLKDGCGCGIMWRCEFLFQDCIFLYVL